MILQGVNPIRIPSLYIFIPTMYSYYTNYIRNTIKNFLYSLIILFLQFGNIVNNLTLYCYMKNITEVILIKSV